MYDFFSGFGLFVCFHTVQHHSGNVSFENKLQLIVLPGT